MAASYRPRWRRAIRQWALAASTASATLGCHRRTTIEPYGHCGPYAPAGAKPAATAFERGTPGILRVRGGDDLGGPLLVSYRLAAVGDTAALLRAISDTGLAIPGLGAGRYVLRALAIGHHPLATTFDFGPDTGAAATIRLERGAVSLCEDGIRRRRSRDRSHVLELRR